MPGTLFGHPYDEEIFMMQWQAARDPITTALYDSGVIQPNDLIRGYIANGSNLYTIPVYDVLGGTPDNYDGSTDIETTAPTAHSQTGVVWGRAHSWKDKDFIHEFNSGADPTRNIASQVGKFWHKQRQKTLLAILNGVFAIPDDTTERWDSWALHTTNIATTTASVEDTNIVGATTAGDAIQKAVGEHAEQFTMAVMHSKIANRLAGLEVLQYRKYTDAMGIQRLLRIADWNGLTVVIDDGVPVSASASATGEREYTTYFFGAGAFQYAPAPVKHPVEPYRVPLKEGGYDILITRWRETLHPNGFSFALPPNTVSPTNAQLGEGATTASNWSIVEDPLLIPIARLITNG